MKMKNYLLYRIDGDCAENSLALNVAVSHREILRLASRLESDQSSFKIVNNIDNSDGEAVFTDDLYASLYSDSRFFRIVKR